MDFLRCGSGLSGEQLTEEGHYWVGVDISEHMLGMLYHDVVPFENTVHIICLSWLPHLTKISIYG